MNFALLTCLLLPFFALAAEPEAPPPESTAHFDVEAGFMGGERDSRTAGFTFVSGDGGAVGKSLVAPFARFPFSGARVFGPAWELRQVIDHARFIVGVQKPYTSFLLSDGASVGPSGETITARALSMWELRFGLGGEYTFGRVTPFVDVVGQLEWLTADLTVDNGPVSYRAQSFSLTARAGARIQLGRSVYVAPTGELGLIGTVRWGAQLMVGVKLPFD